MAKKNAVQHEFYNDEEAQVYVYLPENTGDGSSRVSQIETVTVNGKCFDIRRGEDNYVSLPVYEALCAKFPSLLTR